MGCRVSSWSHVPSDIFTILQLRMFYIFFKFIKTANNTCLTKNTQLRCLEAIKAKIIMFLFFFRLFCKLPSGRFQGQQEQDTWFLANGKCSCRLTSSAGKLVGNVCIAKLKVIYIERHSSWKSSRNQRALQFWRSFVLGLASPGLLQEAQAGSAFAPMRPLALRVREQSWRYWIFQASLT